MHNWMDGHYMHMHHFCLSANAQLNGWPYFEVRCHWNRLNWQGNFAVAGIVIANVKLNFLTYRCSFFTQIIVIYTCIVVISVNNFLIDIKILFHTYWHNIIITSERPLTTGGGTTIWAKLTPPSPIKRTWNFTIPPFRRGEIWSPFTTHAAEFIIH